MRVLIILLLFSFNAFSQNSKIVRNAPDDYVHLLADKNPEFKGDVYRFLASNVKFPKEARDNNITGKVRTTFVISKNGTVDNVKVIESVHPALDAEAIRVIKGMDKKWKPGEIDGKKVDVQFQMPIVFSIN